MKTNQKSQGIGKLTKNSGKSQGISFSHLTGNPVKLRKLKKLQMYDNELKKQNSLYSEKQEIHHILEKQVLNEQKTNSICSQVEIYTGICLLD